MNPDNDTSNLLNTDNYEKAKLPTGLNVLTILTFIGCGVFGLLTMCTPLINDFFLKYLNKQLASGRDFTAKELASLEKGKEAIALTQQHLIPLMTIGMIGIALCLVGALWMRKLKKDGFWLYTAGELAPVIGGAIILGFEQYKSIGSLFQIIIPIVWVLLYAFQRKYLTK
jgi:hypothetical protein